MLRVDFIKDNFSKVIDSLKKRNKDYSSDLKKIIDFNESRKKQQTKLDTLLSEVNTLSKQIGELFKNGKVDEANELKKEVEKIKPEIKLLQELLNSNNRDLQELLCSIPNVPNELVKKGSDENDNEIFKVNFLNQFYFTQHISKMMIRTDGSKGIVNISSSSGLDNDTGRSVYSASKASMISISSTLSKELSAFKIRVNTIGLF